MEGATNTHTSLPLANSFSLQTAISDCYGLGTLERPRIKFYFASGSPELGTETGSVPDLGVRPSFQVKGTEVLCR